MKQIFYVVGAFSVFTAWLYFLYLLSDGDDRLRFPRQLEDLKSLAIVAENYKLTRPLYTMIFFVSVYLYKQSFAIPGSFLLNLLSGAMYGLWGFPLCCLMSACGATSCYLLSQTFGKDILLRFFPERIKYFNDLVDKNRNSGLFSFLISLRLFPMTPNWLINMASPVVGVPVLPFFFSVFIGLMPYNYMTVQAGEILKSLESTSDVMTYKSMLVLIVMAGVNIAPMLAKKMKPKTG